MTEGIGEINITATSNTSLVPDALIALKKEKDNYISRKIEDGLSVRELSQGEKNQFQKIIETVKEKLFGIDMSNIVERAPSIDDIVVFNDSESPYASIDNYNTFIAIHLPPGEDLTGKKTRDIFYHESSHFIAKTIFHVGDKIRDVYRECLAFDGRKNIQVISRGFSRPHYIVEKGSYEEGVADLFSAYCSEEETETPYLYNTSFWVAFCKDFSVKVGISEFEAFKNVFKAKTNQDLGVMKKMMSVYGKDFVRKLNNSEFGPWIPAEVEDVAFKEVAKIGGFEGEYESNISKLKKGDTVGLDGMKGKLKLAK